MPRDDIDDILDRHKDSPATPAPKEAPKLDEIDDILNRYSSKPDLVDDYAGKGVSLLNKAGRGLLGGIGAAGKYVDSVTGAPIRAGLGALQHGDGVGAAFQAAGHQFARDPEEAPTGKDLAERAGFSTEETVPSPVIMNPWKKSENMLSPAGIVGGGVEALADPLTYIPGELAVKGVEGAAKGAEALSKPVSRYLTRVAEERAVKAGTGGNISALRKMAGMTGRGGDAEQAYDRLRGIGKNLLSTDEAGGPVVGWADNAKSIGEKASAKADFYGKKIGGVAEKMDEAFPKEAANAAAQSNSGGSIIGNDLAKEIEAYAATIPPHGEGRSIRNRLAEEAQQFRDRGSLTFKDVHDAKQQYPFKATASDALISNQDATNKIKSILTKGMDKAVGDAESINYVPESLASDYKEARSKYGSYRPEADAAGDQALKTLSNRVLSPSSYAVGGLTAVAKAAKTGLDPVSMIVGAATAIGHETVKNRGSAFVARSAKLVADKVAAAPEKFEKWLPYLGAAARGGGASLSVAHHLLLNNDPDYRERMMDGGPE